MKDRLPGIIFMTSALFAPLTEASCAAPATPPAITQTAQPTEFSIDQFLAKQAAENKPKQELPYSEWDTYQTSDRLFTIKHPRWSAGEDFKIFKLTSPDFNNSLTITRDPKEQDLTDFEEGSDLRLEIGGHEAVSFSRYNEQTQDEEIVFMFKVGEKKFKAEIKSRKSEYLKHSGTMQRILDSIIFSPKA